MTETSSLLLSIFVPCYNEEKNIFQTLETIAQAIQSIEAEILVVDDERSILDLLEMILKKELK